MTQENMDRTFLLYGRSIHIIFQRANQPSRIFDLMEYFGEISEVKQGNHGTGGCASSANSFCGLPNIPFLPDPPERKDWPYFTQSKSESGNAKNPWQLGRVWLPYRSNVRYETAHCMKTAYSNRWNGSAQHPLLSYFPIMRVCLDVARIPPNWTDV